jgi:hypothetical protein
MTWAVMCECSGTIRDALLARGIDAVSIDIKPTRKLGPHIQGDALEYLHKRWAGVIAHPVCTYLTNAGACHLYLDGRKENGRDPQRWADLHKAAAFFNAFKVANAPRIAIENPIPHCHARALIGKPTQYVQPWWFGDPFFKATGWWLRGLPRLVATNKLTPPKSGTDEHKAWSYLHRLPPSDQRQELRSNTFPGHAAAVADQWGVGDLVSMMEAA